jgi:hypothetical protein
MRITVFPNERHLFYDFRGVRLTVIPGEGQFTGP